MKTTIIIHNLSTQKIYLKAFFICFFFLLSNHDLTAQTQLAVGASIGAAPTFGYEGGKNPGTVVSVFGDLTLKKNFIGRAAFTSALATSSNGRFAVNGSLGYNITIGDLKLEIPIMATLGYVGIFYETPGNRWYDASMQIGGTISPQYFVTDRLAVNLTARLLKGTQVNNGGNIDLTDISVGIKFALFNSK